MISVEGVFDSEVITITSGVLRRIVLAAIRDRDFKCLFAPRFAREVSENVVARARYHRYAAEKKVAKAAVKSKPVKKPVPKKPTRKPLPKGTPTT